MTDVELDGGHCFGFRLHLRSLYASQNFLSLMRIFC